MIPFNIPMTTGFEENYIREAIINRRLSGEGAFTKKCNEWIENRTKTQKALLTTSCTHALEMAAMLIGAEPEGEVIMPSYTFVSTANAFVLRSMKIVFVDIRPDTMNIDETKIEAAITGRTRAIVPVHYAGVGCEMDSIMELANKYNLVVIEDAAQGVMSSYKGKCLGSIGHMGCYSFHETKNYTSGEGGAILINDRKYVERAEIIREKGTNRTKFLCGEIDRYTWIDVGSSYLPSELNAAFLYAQLEKADHINKRRLALWERYYSNLKEMEREGVLELPFIPSGCSHNGHIFYVKTSNMTERSKLIEYLKDKGVQAVFHYVPLHSSASGRRYGMFVGEDRYTTKESERLLRLPLYYDLEPDKVDYITEQIKKFFRK